VRYHAKYMVIDRRRLLLLGFNFTALDMKRSRSFGLEIRQKALVKDALELFEADASRQPVPPVNRSIVLSPVNARERLSAFIKGARRELLIYDPKLSDTRMLRLIQDRARAGVSVRVLGRVAKSATDIRSERLSGPRLHVRAMVRDRGAGFVGSQSLKRLELDQRRELGIVFRDAKLARQIAEVFEEDWAKASPKSGERDKASAEKNRDVEVASVS
jgi:cardiolipin synthase